MSTRCWSMLLVMASGLTLAGCDALKEKIEEKSGEKPQVENGPPPELQMVDQPPANGAAASVSPAPPPAPTPQEVIDAFLAKPANQRTQEDVLQLAELPEGLEQITVLSLRGARISNGAMDVMPKFPELQELDVGETAINSLGLKSIPECKKLVKLQFDTNKAIDGQGLKFLEEATTLEYINMSGTLVADVDITYLHKLPALQVLVAAGNENLYGRDFTLLLKNPQAFPALRELYVGGTHWGTYGLNNVNKLEDLEVLEISSSETADGVLEGLTACKKLRVLGASGNVLTPVCMKDTISKLKGLEELNLANNIGINKLVLPLFKGLKVNLKKLDVTNTSLTAEEVDQLKKTLPETTIRYDGKEI